MNPKVLASIGFAVLALRTVMPGAASKLNRFGYFSVCSFAPISTAILIVLSLIFFYISHKEFKKRSEMEKIKVKNARTVIEPHTR